jgi:uncharacterized membrane protein
MIAVKEGTNTPDSVFLPAVIVDTIIPYTWMGILIALSAYQERFDRWNKSNMALIEELQAKITTVSAGGGRGIGKIFAMLGISAFGAVASLYIAGKMPVVNNLVNTMAWTIIIATLLGIALSFTPVRGLESAGASKFGFAVLFFVLASIGAKANFSHITTSPIFLLAGITWIAIHLVFLLIAARLLRSPLSLAASASQAAVGGPASAPVVAGIYNPQLAPVGLLLAVLGNIMGTFLGLCCSYLCGLAAKI